MVLSNDMDVLVLLINYFFHFLSRGVQQLWIKYGLGDKTCYIPIHTLAQRLGKDMCGMLLKSHVLTGCDVTSKLGTKGNALKANLHLLIDFGTENHPDSLSLLHSERYLCSVLYPKDPTSFDDMRYFLYTKKKKPLSDNQYVVGDKCVKDDSGNLSFDNKAKKVAWKQHYERLLGILRT